MFYALGRRRTRGLAQLPVHCQHGVLRTFCLV